jgi:CheY-like chemotaxis protein
LAFAPVSSYNLHWKVVLSFRRPITDRAKSLDLAAKFLSGTSSRSPMGLRLLIVDDSRDVVETLSLLLKHEGFEVQVAYDGQQAIEVALAFHPDVFILDLGMPILDGFQVAKQLRAMPEFEHSTFVALTGHSEQVDLDDASKAQFDEYVLKPPKMSLLLTILSEVSSKSESRI